VCAHRTEEDLMFRGTPQRGLRIPTDLWQASRAQARREGTTVTAVVVEFLRTYTTRTTEQENQP
jgi:hypothetical protein